MTFTGVVGHPVAHSRSPAMMRAAFAALGLDWRYFRLPVPPGLFAATVRALPRSGYAGVNVTIPHKLAALGLADAATPAARAVGAANTLTFADGDIEADNTDAAGILDALGGDAQGVALVLGAGGAGRAAAWALRGAGAEVWVWNRTPERAAALAAALGVGHAERPRPARLVVNATSVGMHGEEDAPARLGLDRLEPPETLLDLVYGERPTALARWAESTGARVVEGLEVLVRQGARSLERWTGRPPPVDVMRSALSRSV